MSKVLEVGVTVFGNRMELGTKWVGYLRVGPKWERNPNEDGFILTHKPVHRESDEMWYKAPISKRQRRTLAPYRTDVTEAVPKITLQTSKSLTKLLHPHDI